MFLALSRSSLTCARWMRMRWLAPRSTYSAPLCRLRLHTARRSKRVLAGRTATTVQVRFNKKERSSVDGAPSTSGSPGGTAISIARWILVLPAAIAGAVAARWFIVLMNRIGMLQAGLDPSFLLWTVIDRYVSGLALGAAFVYCGTAVAPAGRRATAAVLAGFTVSLMGGAFFPSLGSQLYWNSMEILFIVVGAVAVAVAAWGAELFEARE